MLSTQGLSMRVVNWEGGMDIEQEGAYVQNVEYRCKKDFTLNQTRLSIAVKNV